MIYGPYRTVMAVPVNKPINTGVIENPKMFCFKQLGAILSEGNMNIDDFRSTAETVSAVSWWLVVSVVGKPRFAVCAYALYAEFCWQPLFARFSCLPFLQP
jgi:hypothetical protein